MATEYGIRDDANHDTWYSSQEYASKTARKYGLVLIAREVSEPRIVSIRA